MQRCKWQSVAQIGFQFFTDVRALFKRVWWVMALHNSFHTVLHIAKRFRVAVSVEMVMGNRIKDHLSYISRTDFSATHSFIAHGLPNQLAFCGFVRLQLLRTVAVTLTDTRRHKVRAQHTGADLVCDQF